MANPREFVVSFGRFAKSGYGSRMGCEIVEQVL